jgi:hypothetical protein
MSVISEKVLETTLNYIGPASKMFLERQTTRHMNNLPFDNLDKIHLPDLVKWIKVSGRLLIGEAKAEELGNKVAQIH